ncbi:hypothetical protein [Bacillus proteolyticus]|nr:hypothetical protein [Bacillus sp. NH11B]
MLLPFLLLLIGFFILGGEKIATLFVY